ncbi:hypothetical protein Glove_196g6 [Diversispora epigaea]|uniref:Uncharacterized protein n=1 Tax=Diversispora epigaea TaxID=1348612 RepID=A0A397IKM1_9GLOM|nr:hypothetical protein Glove_196g6 [Diversispora epigaea]
MPPSLVNDRTLLKYIGTPSKIRRPYFLKISKYLYGSELDIYYPQYSFSIEVQGEPHEKYIEFFTEMIPIILSNSKYGYVWYYEDQYTVISEHLENWPH